MLVKRQCNCLNFKILTAVAELFLFDSSDQVGFPMVTQENTQKALVLQPKEGNLQLCLFTAFHYNQ